jgi:hypothetical protein
VCGLKQQEYGVLMDSNKEISSTEQIPGKSFALWVITFSGILPGPHTAVHLDFDTKGTAYFVTKNGSYQRPVFQTLDQMPYYLMSFRTNYKPNKL